MVPQLRIKELREVNATKKKAKSAGVVALFYPDDANRTNLLLTLRKTYKGVHSNQVAFPGGKKEDEDVDIRATALRETYEEVGVPSDKLSLIRPLSTVYIKPSNFIVHPFIGLYSTPEPFMMQEDEVQALLEVPLRDFMNDLNIITEKINTSYGHNMEVPCFKLNGYVVWGATAMMLSEIKELLKQVF